MKTRGSTARSGEHLVFLWSSSGYTLEARPGAVPAVGAAVENGTGRYHVARIGPSPLPGDERVCAYLLPDGLEPRVEHDDASKLAKLIGEYPEGLCAVAVDAEGRRQVLTVSTLVSLSLDPPLVGFAVDSGEDLVELLPVAGGCAISLLAGGQDWLADHYATGARPIAMWHGLGAEPGAIGAPLFVGALGWLECTYRDAIPAGSHVFVVCEVLRVETGQESPALVRTRDEYRSV